MIGINLVRRLSGRNDRLFFVCRPSASQARLSAIRDFGKVLVADVTDRDSIQSAFRSAEPDLVYHLASTPFNMALDAATHCRVVTLGTLHVLEAMREFPNARLVFTGSVAEYGGGSGLGEDHPLRPATLLGAVKANATTLIETYSRLYGLTYVILRIFTSYGPWEQARRLIPHAITSVLDGRDVLMTRGDQQRDFVYVDDVVDALVLAGGSAGPAREVFNIGSGVGVPVRNVVSRIVELMGGTVRVRSGALETRADEIMEMSADITAARARLGWQPKTTLDQGLAQSIEWIRRNPGALEN